MEPEEGTGLERPEEALVVDENPIDTTSRVEKEAEEELQKEENLALDQGVELTPENILKLVQQRSYKCLKLVDELCSLNKAAGFTDGPELSLIVESLAPLQVYIFDSRFKSKFCCAWVRQEMLCQRK